MSRGPPLITLVEKEAAHMHDELSGVLLALTIVIGVGVLAFIAVLIALAVVAMRASKRVKQLMQQYETSVAPHIGPMVSSARSLVEDLSPKIKHIASNLVEVSDTVRGEAQHITVSVSDVVERTHQQAARVDHIVSSTLNGLGHATAAVQEGIAVPIRHLSGVLDGLRAGFGSLRRRRPHPNGTSIVRKVEQDPF
jgi:methyl-accepting chemotaxis protein